MLSLMRECRPGCPPVTRIGTHIMAAPRPYHIQEATLHECSWGGCTSRSSLRLTIMQGFTGCVPLRACVYFTDALS
jgi:hypothetical protein